LFNGAYKPTAETWATSTAAPQRDYRKGLYEVIQKYSESPSERGKVGGKLQTKIGIIRRFLHLFHKLARAMESTTGEATIQGLDTMDIHFLDILLPALTTLLNDYKDLYRPPTFALESQFSTMANLLLKENQPHVPDTVFRKTLIRKSSGYSIGSSVIAAAGAGSQMTYGTLFYCFLEVLRDYLNHIAGTVDKQCRLPTFLLKPGK
jgi:hypothetical protein